jgi:hypothetical protein
VTVTSEPGKGSAFTVRLPGGARGMGVADRVRRIGLLMGVADDREGQARVTALKQGLRLVTARLTRVVGRYAVGACRRHRRALLKCSNAPASSLPSINSAR